MARKKHYGSMKESMHMERDSHPMTTNHEARSHRGGMTKAMMPNEPRASFIQEDWSEPALLKRGVHEFDVAYGANRHRSGRIGDLYEQVTKTMKEDQQAFDKLTDPHNW